MKILKRASFGLLGIALLVLASGTILEKTMGTDFVHTHIYSSAFFVVLWAGVACSALAYIIRCKLHRRWATCLVHLAFLLILSGALATRLWGEQGTVRLHKGAWAEEFRDKKDVRHPFPFRIRLNDFEVVYYPGTRAPMDYVSTVTLTDKADGEADSTQISGRISMNRILSHKHYRLYQSGYDESCGTVTLAVSHDPCGIAVTYTGYALLLLSFLLFFTDRQSAFRRLLRGNAWKAAACLCLLGCPPALRAADGGGEEMPKVLPADVAARFGDLYILYNNRICPLQTLAKDFTQKLYGKPTYRGLTPEQVFTGWMFWYSSWKRQPVVKIESPSVRRVLGVKGRYASLSHFTDETNAYKLDSVLRRITVGEPVADKRKFESADEKYNLIAMLYSGRMLKIYPHRPASGGALQWFAQADKLPADLPDDEYIFIRKSQSYVQEMVMKKDYEALSALLDKIKQYQAKRAAGFLPGEARFRAEKLYNAWTHTRPVAMACITLGLLAFCLYCRQMTVGRPVAVSLKRFLRLLLALCFAYLTVTLALRGYVARHLPLSNGYETMQFMAWCVSLLTFLLQRRFPPALPFGLLLCGFALLVSTLGEANPQITQLMPVLSSPLLSVHVMVIMMAYSLLGFIMLNGVTAVLLHISRRNCIASVERLYIVSRLLLYPAVFLLAAGIFIGAVWANVSWGRYWGWDPKEVWALITLLVYGLALHPASLPWFRRPLFFHVFTVVAFICVLITYFGVNFLLGGMHSYA